MTSVFAFFSCTMTACLTYSMMKLRKFSSLLAADGILASKRLLGLHVVCFWIVSGLEIASMIVTILLNQDFKDSKELNKNLALAQQYLDVTISTVFFLIMLTMLVMFVKFGTPLSSAEKSTISMRFLLNFNAEEFGKKRKKKGKG